jgi:hypothetical protein
VLVLKWWTCDLLNAEDEGVKRCVGMPDHGAEDDLVVRLVSDRCDVLVANGAEDAQGIDGSTFS